MRIHAFQINKIFILYTEVALFLINCEHQLSFSPQHNFQIIKKNGRGGGKEGDTVTVLSAEHQSWGVVKGNLWH